jgi:hypothetical protein
VVLVVLAVAVGALGGWARTTPDGIRVVPPGSEVDATPLRVRLDRAEATYEAAGATAEPGRAFLVVEGHLTLDHQESVGSGVVSDTFAMALPSAYDRFGDPTDEPEAAVYVAEDGSALLGLGPGLTYRVQLVYEVDESAVPTTATVTLQKHVRRPSFLDGFLGWFDPTPFARVTLDVAPLPDERPSEDAL